MYTQDIFGRSRSVRQRYYCFPELQIDGDLQHACSRLIELTWRYNAPTKERVENYRVSLSLPSSYIGLHIRGGDKSSEANIYDIKPYMDKVQEMTHIRSVFVLTDNYAIYENLQASYLDWTFYTFCGQAEHGYYHDQFMSEGVDVKKERLIRLFASMDILANSELFVGTYSSNPGMYLGMRMPSDRVFGIDFPQWRIW